MATTVMPPSCPFLICHTPEAAEAFFDEFAMQRKPVRARTRRMTFTEMDAIAEPNWADLGHNFSTARYVSSKDQVRQPEKNGDVITRSDSGRWLPSVASYFDVGAAEESEGLRPRGN